MISIINQKNPKTPSLYCDFMLFLDGSYIHSLWVFINLAVCGGQKIIFIVFFSAKSMKLAAKSGQFSFSTFSQMRLCSSEMSPKMWTITLSGQKRAILMMASHSNGERRTSRRTFESFHPIRNRSHWKLTRKWMKYEREVSIFNPNIQAGHLRKNLFRGQIVFNEAEYVLHIFSSFGSYVYWITFFDKKVQVFDRRAYCEVTLLDQTCGFVLGTCHRAEQNSMAAMQCRYLWMSQKKFPFFRYFFKSADPTNTS